MNRIRKTLIVLLFIGFSFVGFSQTYEGDLTLTTQAEVDAFNYTEVTGDIAINSNNGGMSNLNGLESLTSIDGSLYIQNNRDLLSLEGLKNITSVGENLWVTGNDSLINLEGLRSVTYIGGTLSVGHNAELINLNGFSNNLSSIKGNLSIGSQNKLINLNGLEAITSVEGNIYIGSNSALISLEGIGNIVTVGGNLYIGNKQEGAQYGYDANSNLTNLCAVKQLITNGQITSSEYFVTGNAYNPSYEDIQNDSSCSVIAGDNGNGVFGGNIILQTQEAVDAFNYSEITGNLVIYSGNSITNLNSLGSLTSVWSHIRIENNNNLTNLNGLNNISSIGGDLNIYNNSSLTSLKGLDALGSVGSNLNIFQNHILPNLDGLGNITIVKGNINIWSNNNLTVLSGLDSLTSTGGLFIGTNSNGFDRGNNALTNLSGFNKLTLIEGNLSIGYNPSLTDINGLETISLIKGDFRITNNNTLINLIGLNALTTVEGAFSITWNIALMSFNGLDNLTSIDGDLSIYNNDALTNLNSLNSLTSVRGELEISNNDVLDNLCGVQQLIINNQITNSEYKIYTNAYNPTYEEIQTNCSEEQEETVSKPTLITPVNEATNMPNNTTSIFTWSESNWADTTKTDYIAYQFHLWEAGETPVVQFVPAGNTSPNTVTTKQNTTYSWKVVAVDGQGTALATSETWSFTTKVDSVSSELTYIPDDNFEQVLIDRGLDDVLDDYVKTSNINSEVELFIRNKSITDLTGIEGFESLKELYCENNKITNLDLSKNSALEVLSCNYNEIENLNISGISGIKHLLCHSNKLVSLDVTQHLNLNSLLCSYNNIATLNFNNIY